MGRVRNVSYNPANQILQLNAATFSETRSYNANLQMTELVSGANVHLKYNYSGTQNNGRITSMQDVISGETVSYIYDSLNRLIQASGTGDPSGAWSQQFTFDGFGNLTYKNGSNAPTNAFLATNPATNRLTTGGAGYDNNGNLTSYGTGSFAAGYAYDIENRMTVSAAAGAATETLFGYDPSNQRVYQGTYNTSTGAYSNEQVYFYGADGKKLVAFNLQVSGSNVTITASQTKVWFAGRILAPQDRLQSQGKYFPYGEDRTNTTPANPANDQEKFATYTRDSATGLDYAYQRYYGSQIGRFQTVDPASASARPGVPQSWNRYPYVENDPVTNIDPSGALLPELDPWGCNTIFGAGFSSGSINIGGGLCISDLLYLPIAYQGGKSRPLQCNIELVSQMIKPSGVTTPFNHTSIILAFGVGATPIHIEGVPLNGYLTAVVGTSAYYKDTAQGPVWNAGFSSSNCSLAQQILNSANSFPKNKFSYLLVEQNSNSLTHALLVTKESVLPTPYNLMEAANLRTPGWLWPLRW